MDDLVSHIPTIAQRSDGAWGVYCIACSRIVEDYVFPCRVRTDDVFPKTGRLIESE